jgi:Fe-S cluster assembly scaffold protein SufB
MNMLEEFQKKANERMISLDYPSKKYGQGMVMNHDVDFDDVIGKVSYVNSDLSFGKVGSDSSDSNGVIVTSYLKLLVQDGSGLLDDVNSYLSGLISEVDDFDKIKLGLISKFNDFVVVYIKDGVNLSSDLFLDTFFSEGVVGSNVLIVAKKNSKVTIIDRVESTRKCEFASRNIHVVCEKGAHVNVVGINNFDMGSNVIMSKTSQVESEGLVTFNDFLAGGKYVNFDVKSYLVGVGANSKINNAIVNNNSLHDIKNDVIHNESNTHAYIKSKSVVVKGRSVFRGTINIPLGSKDCVSHQLVNNLLIEDEARADAVPILDVSNDDVSCSHGATISEIDDEDIYYLTSRGVSSDGARKIIIKGFVQSIIDEFDLSQFEVSNEFDGSDGTGVSNGVVLSGGPVGLIEEINEKIFGVVRKNV